MQHLRDSSQRMIRLRAKIIHMWLAVRKIRTLHSSHAKIVICYTRRIEFLVLNATIVNVANSRPILRIPISTVHNEMSTFHYIHRLLRKMCMRGLVDVLTCCKQMHVDRIAFHQWSVARMYTCMSLGFVDADSIHRYCSPVFMFRLFCSHFHLSIDDLPA